MKGNQRSMSVKVCPKNEGLEAETLVTSSNPVSQVLW